MGQEAGLSSEEDYQPKKKREKKREKKQKSKKQKKKDHREREFADISKYLDEEASEADSEEEINSDAEIKDKSNDPDFRWTEV